MTVNVCPSLLTEGHNTYSDNACRLLFNGRHISHVLSFSSPGSTGLDENNAIGNVCHVSLSGAQPKFGLILDTDNTLRYSLPNEQSSYILKPRPIGYHIINHDCCAANENLTMQLAAQIYAIETAANGICFFSDGQPAYLTRRFDVHRHGKYQQEDFASLLGYTRHHGGSDYKYCNSSYEECAEVIKKHVKLSKFDTLRFYRLILFNFIVLNDDAHLKNFSLINNGMEYRLSPAYDLVNTSLLVRQPRIFALDNGLFKEGMNFSDINSINPKDFIQFGRRIGLPLQLIRNEINRFAAPNPNADALIQRSFLPNDLKRLYLLNYHYRQSLLRID